MHPDEGQEEEYPEKPGPNDKRDGQVDLSEYATTDGANQHRGSADDLTPTEHLVQLGPGQVTALRVVLARAVLHPALEFGSTHDEPVHFVRAVRQAQGALARVHVGQRRPLGDHSEDAKDDDSIKCVLEGPLSLFKMTDRYGTSMAKLLPSIVGTPTWKINGSIVKKTDEGQKIYSFELSNDDTQEFLRSTIDTTYQNNGNVGNDDYVYDSSIGTAFAKRFHQHFDPNDKFGWKISREPDPLIADGKAMIPDFLFERFGRKVYLEIVGFWTKEYLERKTAKLKVLFDNNEKNKNNKSIDLLVAVNSELSCSQIETISKDRVFTFKKDVSLKPILEHLKKIDVEITEEKINDTQIKLDENNLDLISITQIAQEHAIPETAALKILNADYPDVYLTVDSYLISKEKTDAVNNSLDGVSKFVQACIVMKSHKIPDSCHADLLSKLGYDVVWNDLDSNNATIIKK